MDVMYVLPQICPGWGASVYSFVFMYVHSRWRGRTSNPFEGNRKELNNNNAYINVPR